jgi:hypothetical protein
MSEDKKPVSLDSLWATPSVVVPPAVSPVAAKLEAQREPASGNLKLDFQSVGTKKPTIWAVTAFDWRSGLGVTIPGDVDRGMSAGSFYEGGRQTWFSGLYRTVPVSGVQVGVIGGRMMDMVPNSDGIAQRQNDRLMGGLFVSAVDNKGSGVEMKCLDSPKDNIKPVCAISYKFKLD